MTQSGRRLFTSEAVCEGHPDKLADQISDAILDALLEQDRFSRVACETLLKSGLAIVAGEVTTRGYCEIPVVVRQCIKEVGYSDYRMGYDYRSVGVLTMIEGQSPDIAQGVDEDATKQKDLGAGDQGIMFGYACRETEELMPLPIVLARKICNRLAEIRHSGELRYLRPDGKSQVTVEYEGDTPVRLHTIVVSAQHDPDVSLEVLRHDIIEHVVKPLAPRGMLDDRTIYHVNPTGRFVEGGPKADCGLTGRKIIVDTYGGMGHHGGGCFSGKDPTKVDRSACYFARYAAKNVVAAGLADRCELQLGYAIGVSQPVSVAVDTYGTGKVADAKIVDLLRKHFDFTPSGMIKHLDLRRPIYKQTARKGHFGIDHPDYTWEITDKAEMLAREAGLVSQAKAAAAAH